MSENLKQFFNLLANNPEIKEKALACNELGKEKGLLALIELAKEQGMELSEADFVASEGELSENELDSVSGGAFGDGLITHEGHCGCMAGGGGGGHMYDDGATYGCACVAYGQGGDGKDSHWECVCLFMGDG